MQNYYIVLGISKGANLDKIKRAYRTVVKKHHPDVQYRPTSYMQGFFTGLVFVECLKRADKAGDLTGDGLVKALQSIKDFDVGGLMAPITVVNNKIPMGRVYKANVGKKMFEPISDWIRTD